MFAAERPGANDLMQLIFTSGTTGEPKGVLHTANTMFANVIPFAERMGLTRDDVGFSPTPIAHQLGYLYGVLTPLMLGGKVVLQDIWQPEIAATLIAAERVDLSAWGRRHSSMTWLTMMGLAGADTSTLRYFISGGAPIPPGLVRAAKARIGCKVISVWGMTEISAVTTVLPTTTIEAFETDGIAMPHCEVRIVDVRQVGRELGVRYVLEGSVRKAGSRVRITGQLVEAATGTHLWADRFEGTLKDVFDLQDQITASVVRRNRAEC